MVNGHEKTFLDFIQWNWLICHKGLDNCQHWSRVNRWQFHFIFNHKYVLRSFTPRFSMRPALFSIQLFFIKIRNKLGHYYSHLVQIKLIIVRLNVIHSLIWRIDSQCRHLLEQSERYANGSRLDQHQTNHINDESVQNSVRWLGFRIGIALYTISAHLAHMSMCSVSESRSSIVHSSIECWFKFVFKLALIHLALFAIGVWWHHHAC